MSVGLRQGSDHGHSHKLLVQLVDCEERGAQVHDLDHSSVDPSHQGGHGVVLSHVGGEELFPGVGSHIRSLDLPPDLHMIVEDVLYICLFQAQAAVTGRSAPLQWSLSLMKKWTENSCSISTNCWRSQTKLGAHGQTAGQDVPHMAEAYAQAVVQRRQPDPPQSRAREGAALLFQNPHTAVHGPQQPPMCAPSTHYVESSPLWRIPGHPGFHQGNLLAATFEWSNLMTKALEAKEKCDKGNDPWHTPERMFFYTQTQRPLVFQQWNCPQPLSQSLMRPVSLRILFNPGHILSLTPLYWILLAFAQSDLGTPAPKDFKIRFIPSSATQPSITPRSSTPHIRTNLTVERAAVQAQRVAATLQSVATPRLDKGKAPIRPTQIASCYSAVLANVAASQPSRHQLSLSSIASSHLSSDEDNNSIIDLSSSPAACAARARPQPHYRFKNPVVIVLSSDSGDFDAKAALSLPKKEPLPPTLPMQAFAGSFDLEYDDISLAGLEGANSDYADDTGSCSPIPSTIWSRHWHVIDIIKGFEACNLVARSSSVYMQDAFKTAFPGVKYTRGTFYAHCDRWNSAAKEIKKKYINYWRADEGLWRCS
ncbi:hypothetical protein PHLGIDRAFT_508673 [Phlebiopsis gigantea 11061_1 CR5-6]|uniref:Uncharacterized protein n=1 Tax=Phlebiopsis gigantea (strain 11061_1 CR5-6) TaxID=745531 RepID=A0A0C3P949_PHLG1|nr:hypothetical protein PHLGIDRAFT_508673 [Phlebiopsis gigantea 11061_1 CR5-6]